MQISDPCPCKVILFQHHQLLFTSKSPFPVLNSSVYNKPCLYYTSAIPPGDSKLWKNGFVPGIPSTGVKAVWTRTTSSLAFPATFDVGQVRLRNLSTPLSISLSSSVSE